MKTYAVLTVSALALSLGACGPQSPAARTALDCPATQGDLTRTGVAADGKICTYTTSGGAEVSLQLVSTQGGDADRALKVIETQLLSGRIAPPKSADGKPASPRAGETADEIAADIEAGIEADVQAAVADAAHDAAASGVDAVASGAHNGIVIGEDDNGTAHINLPGIHIVANERDETANVKIGPLTVNAGGNGATVRMSRPVRLHGEALRREKRGIRATFIYTGKDLADGYRFVGYEAAGPRAGPLAVAIVKSKADGPDGDQLYPDVQKLVRRNGGV